MLEGSIFALTTFGNSSPTAGLVRMSFCFMAAENIVLSIVAIFRIVLADRFPARLPSGPSRISVHLRAAWGSCGSWLCDCSVACFARSIAESVT